METEILSDEELVAITGYKPRRGSAVGSQKRLALRREPRRQATGWPPVRPPEAQRRGDRHRAGRSSPSTSTRLDP